MSGIEYFTPAEYGVLMGLTGKDPYYHIKGSGTKCSKEDYRRAYASLYQRGYLERTQDGFALTPEADGFRQIRSARRVLVLSAGDRGGPPKLCCWDGRRCWLVELADSALAPWYRVQALRPGDFGAWLRDSELLEPPVIPEETAAVMGHYGEESLEAPSGPCVFRLECLDVGQLVWKYELLHCGGLSILCRTGGENPGAEIYTEASGQRMLDACFEVIS